MLTTRSLCLSIGLLVGLLNQSTPSVAAPPTDPKSSSSKLRDLQKERLKTLEEQYQGQLERVKTGQLPLVSMADLINELTEARLELAENVATEIKILEKTVEQLREIEEQVKMLQEAGLATKSTVAQARAIRLKGEIQLEKRKLQQR